MLAVLAPCFIGLVATHGSNLSKANIWTQFCLLFTLLRTYKSIMKSSCFPDQYPVFDKLFCTSACLRRWTMFKRELEMYEQCCMQLCLRPDCQVRFQFLEIAEPSKTWITAWTWTSALSAAKDHLASCCQTLIPRSLTIARMRFVAWLRSLCGCESCEQKLNLWLLSTPYGGSSSAEDLLLFASSMCSWSYELVSAL